MMHTDLKTTATILAALAIISVGSLQAERVDAGGYFSVYMPDSWKTETYGLTVNRPGNYDIYKASHIRSLPFIVAGIVVFNDPEPDTIGFNDYLKNDVAELERLNQRTGYSTCTVKIRAIAGIPAILLKERNLKNGLHTLRVNLFAGDKHFLVKFVYNDDGVNTVNKIIDSIQLNPEWAEYCPM